MVESLKLLSDENSVGTYLFETDQDYQEFNREFLQSISPKQEEWAEARMKSEQAARQRILR